MSEASEILETLRSKETLKKQITQAIEKKFNVEIPLRFDIKNYKHTTINNIINCLIDMLVETLSQT